MNQFEEGRQALRRARYEYLTRSRKISLWLFVPSMWISAIIHTYMSWNAESVSDIPLWSWSLMLINYLVIFFTYLQFGYREVELFGQRFKGTVRCTFVFGAVTGYFTLIFLHLWSQ